MSQKLPIYGFKWIECKLSPDKKTQQIYESYKKL